MNQINQCFAAFIGLDKSDKKINVSLKQCGKSKIERTIIEGGAEALLTKPIDFAALRSEIDTRVERAA